jgi:hypothetical protein
MQRALLNLPKSLAPKVRSREIAYPRTIQSFLSGKDSAVNKVSFQFRGVIMMEKEYRMIFPVFDVASFNVSPKN